MSDPRRLLDDPQLGVQEREALRAARREGMPSTQRDQLWAVLAQLPPAAPLPGPASPPAAPPGAAGLPPAPSSPSTGPSAGGAVGASVAGLKTGASINGTTTVVATSVAKGGASAAGVGASVAGTKLAAVGAAGGIWKAGVIGAGLMAAALGAQSVLAPSSSPLIATAPSASVERAVSRPLSSAARPDRAPVGATEPPAARVEIRPAASEAPATPALPVAAIGAKSSGPAVVSPVISPPLAATERANDSPVSPAGVAPTSLAGLPATAASAVGMPAAASVVEVPAVAASAATAIGAQAKAESALVAQARQQLRTGNPTGALALLAEAQRTFGVGILGQEREAIAIEALWLSGQQGQAQSRARAFVAAHPGSLFSARLRELTKIDEK